MQTVEDRSIPIHLKRATRAELKLLAKGRRREFESVLGSLTEKCARWATDNVERLKGLRPQLPDVLSGREQDKWEPLIAIADAIGGETGRVARLAAVTASDAYDPDEAPIGVALLADIRTFFDGRKANRLSSKAICDWLAALEGRPWAEYGKAQKQISQNQLAQLLEPFRTFSHTIRLPDDSTPKGYERKDFEEAWTRYAAEPKTADESVLGDSKRHNATIPCAQGESYVSASATNGSYAGSKNCTSLHGEKNCGDVAPDSGFNSCAAGSLVEEAEIDRLAKADGCDHDLEN